MNALVLACMISVLVVPHAQTGPTPEDLPAGAVIDSAVPSNPTTGDHPVRGSDPGGADLGPMGDGNPQDPPQPVSPATWGALKAVFGR